MMLDYELLETENKIEPFMQEEINYMSVSVAIATLLAIVATAISVSKVVIYFSSIAALAIFADNKNYSQSHE
jgi:hypothetical protein